jgi:chemotaxis signal transduction protein
VRDFCIVIRRPGLHFGLTLSHVQRDLRFPIEERMTDLPVDPDFERYTQGGFKYKDDFLPVLDIDKLVADEELANASAGKGSSIKGKGNE